MIDESDDDLTVSNVFRMKSALLEQGNEFKNLLMATINTGTDMCKRVYTKPKVKDSSHEDLVLKSKAHFNSRQMLAAHGIYQWRDKACWNHHH